jgi:hypothetical protein
MKYVRKQTTYLMLTFVIAVPIIILATSFVDVPLSVKTYAEVFPKEKWLLTVGNGGQIISNYTDYSQGHALQYNISQFERGDFVAVNFLKKINNKNVSAGDTIVNMRSSYILDELVTAEGELNVACADLNAQSSPEKRPLIAEAESRLKYTEEKIGEQKILYDRTKKLYDKGFNSQQEYELQKWNVDLLEIERDIYKAQIENLRTGVKPQETQLLESKVNSIKKRLDFLKSKESQLSIISPIEGRVISSFSPDTLFNVTNFNQVVLHIPVKLIDLTDFYEGQNIPISFSNNREVMKGKILSIDKEVKMINNQQVVFLSLILDNPASFLLPGMVIETSMTLGKITLIKQLTRTITR